MSQPEPKMATGFLVSALTCSAKRRPRSALHTVFVHQPMKAYEQGVALPSSRTAIWARRRASLETVCRAVRAMRGSGSRWTTGMLRKVFSVLRDAPRLPSMMQPVGCHRSISSRRGRVVRACSISMTRQWWVAARSKTPASSRTCEPTCRSVMKRTVSMAHSLAEKQ